MAVKGLSLFLVLILFALLSHRCLAETAADEARLPRIPPSTIRWLLHLGEEAAEGAGGERRRTAAWKKATTGGASRGGGAATNLRRGNDTGSGGAAATVGASWRVAAVGLTLAHLFVFLW